MSVSPTHPGVTVDALLHIGRFLGKYRPSLDATCWTLNSLSTHFDEAVERLIGRLFRLIPDNAAVGAMVRAHQLDKFTLVRENCEQELDALFRLFKKRLSELQVPLFSKKHPALLSKILTSREGPFSLLLCAYPRWDIFRDPIMIELGRRSSEEMAMIYVNQPIDEITAEGMVKLQKLTSSVLGILPSSEVRKWLKKIAQIHTLEKIEAFHLEYLNPAPDSPRFLAVKEKIRLTRIRKKEKIEAKLADIERKQDGIVPAWFIRKKLENVMDQLRPENIELDARSSMTINASFFGSIRQAAFEETDS